ncbi:MAG: class I SAM-dependent methyltransferase, partial [Anaerolineae bacterium]
MNGRGLSKEQVLNSGLEYFDLQAYVGTTKHMGGLAATKELARLCHIGGETLVLDLGCGVGATPLYLARTFGTRVIGVDVRESMVAQARRRAQQEGLARLIDFQVADAAALPFETGLFGAVIGESVVSFVEVKKRVLREVARVTEPDGYVGFNEEVWLSPPPRKLTEFVKRAWDVEPLRATEWVTMLQDAGLRDVAAKCRELNPWREATQLKRYRLTDLGRMIWRTLDFYVTRPAFRTYMAERRSVPSDLFDHLAYAL